MTQPKTARERRDELAVGIYPDEVVRSMIAYDDDFERPRTAEKKAFKKGFNAGLQDDVVKQMAEVVEDFINSHGDTGFKTLEDAIAAYRVAVEEISG